MGEGGLTKEELTMHIYCTTSHKHRRRGEIVVRVEIFPLCVVCIAGWWWWLFDCPSLTDSILPASHAHHYTPRITPPGKERCVDDRRKALNLFDDDKKRERSDEKTGRVYLSHAGMMGVCTCTSPAKSEG